MSSTATTATAGDLAVDVLIEAERWSAAVPGVEAVCAAAARAAFEHADTAGRDAGVCLLLADDDRVRALNRDFRGRDAPTDVLAFPSVEPDVLAAAGADSFPAELGDIVVALQTATADAARDGKSLSDHLSHLIVHGTLHLLGYDHATDPQASEMEDLETRVLATLGIADPYSDRREA